MQLDGRDLVCYELCKVGQNNINRVTSNRKIMRATRITLRHFLVCLLWILFAATGRSIAQSSEQFTKELGLPFIQNFSPKEYDAHSQNWAILQDERGLMYFGNTSGILVYDGVSWQEIHTSKGSVVYCLTMDQQGRIYGGGRGDFGYLAADSVGQLQFVSLMESLPPAYRDFSVIRQVYTTSQGVFFVSPQYLIGLKKGESDKDTLQVWEATTRFHRGYAIWDTIYVTQLQVGLMKLTDDSLRLASNHKYFLTEEGDIYTMLPYPPQAASSSTFLMGSRQHGLFLYDGTTVRSFTDDPAVNKLCTEKSLYTGQWLSDGRLALVLSKAGVAIVNQQGELLQLLNEQSGLRNEEGHAALQDRQGALWMAANNGLSRIEIPSPISSFNKMLGMDGGVNDLVRHQGQLYAATNLGVYRLSQPESAISHPRFQLMNKFSGSVWSLLSADNALWIGSNQGVYRDVQGKIDVAMEGNARFLYHSQHHENLIWVGLENGLAALGKRNGQWQFLGQVDGISEEIRTIVEDQRGDVWLGTSAGDGFLRVRLENTDVISQISKATKIPASVERFQEAQGVPEGYVRVYLVDGRVIFATDAGLKRLDETRNLFVPDTSLGEHFADTTISVSRVVEDHLGNVWIKSTLAGGHRESGVLIRGTDGNYTYHNTSFMRIADWGSVYTMYADPLYDNVLWIGGPEGIIRYDHGVEKNYNAGFQTLIRRVTINDDSLLFAGNPTSQRPVLSYHDNSIRIAFAATSYEQSLANRYQVMLEGFDKRWSGWTDETRKDYTNLPEGEYTFRVHARNLYGQISEEGSFPFSILPPWHRTWWGYMLQGFIAFGLIFVFIRWRLLAMHRQTVKLEQVVEDRTAELAEKNEQLLEMDTIKSRFFANISHEFRTPLTLVMGQIESVLPDLKKPPVIDKLRMAHRNAARLQQLINQLLDLSKFEDGQMTLHASYQNVVPLLRHLTSTFESMAEQKNIKLGFESVQDTIMAYIEQDKLEKIMYNLLSNALKFTPSGGLVLVKIQTSLRNPGRYLPEDSNVNQSAATEEKGDLRIIVRDSGIGIPSNRLPHIFDRFYQVDSSQTREFEGTGIGLALTKELVQLHGGGISVESSEGFGTTFIVTLPLGKTHLKPEQVAATTTDLTGFVNLPNLPDESLSVWEGVTLDNTVEQIHAGNRDIVLIVEDNADMRTYIREGLEKNYSMLEARNGEAGLAKAQEAIPDLIITDAMMPIMDGYELTHQLRRDAVTSHIPIIMLTAKATEEDKFEGLEKGVDAYLTKPFNKKELQIRVRKLIEMRKKLRQQLGAKAVLTPSEIEVPSMDQQFLQSIQDIIEENIDNENFSVDELALAVGVGRRQLERKLKALTGSSPQQCIRTMRLTRARQLLEQGVGTVTEIAFQVGYGDITAFSKAFQAEFHQLPSTVLQKK